jgi:hypothetical protein
MGVSIIEGGFALQLIKAAVLRLVEKGDLHHGDAKDLVAAAAQNLSKAVPNSPDAVAEIADDLLKSIDDVHHRMMHKA